MGLNVPRWCSICPPSTAIQTNPRAGSHGASGEVSRWDFTAPTADSQSDAAAVRMDFEKSIDAGFGVLMRRRVEFGDRLAILLRH